jgi:hydroxymethylpyrimidine/phosphomethylpyrimidine kinase
MNRTTEYRPNAIALTIAGSDPSGGAGLQADLKTFQQFGVYGASVVTMITAQINTLF